MRTIRVAEYVSLDGVMKAYRPNEDGAFANGGWTTPFRSPEGAAALSDAYGENFDLLLGRRTYDHFARFWPKMTGGPFADKLNAATKYVATHRPEGLSWGPANVLGVDVVGAIRGLRSQDGPDLLVCGSSSLTTILLEHGLVDEIVLTVYPVVLGKGTRWYAESADPGGFKLTNSMVTPTGVILCAYKHVGALQAE